MVAVAVDEPPPPRSLVLGALASLVNALHGGQSERKCVCVCVCDTIQWRGVLLTRVPSGAHTTKRIFMVHATKRKLGSARTK